MTIGDRIKIVRETSGKNQRDFASSIKISQPALAMFENGQREPKDIHIEQICMKYDVSDDWLRTGNGEPTIKRTRNQEIQEFANDTMDEVDESFRKRFVRALSRLDEAEWEVLEKIVNEMHKGD